MGVSYETNEFDEEVVKLLKNGGVGFMPSDTIYGLSAPALDKKAVERLYELKKRDKNKPLVILIADTTQLADLGIDTLEAVPALRYWPGKLTIITEANDAPKWLHRGTDSLGVRQPANEELRRLIAEVGPIVSTSANLQAGQPASSVRQAKKDFGDKLDFYVNTGRLRGKPSTIIKENGYRGLEVIRQGAVKVVTSGKKAKQLSQTRPWPK